MIMTRYISVLFVFVLVLNGVNGQDQGAPSGEIESQQIIIEKDKPLTLPQANRIYQPTNIRPIQVDSMRMDYQVTQPTYNFNPYFAKFNFKSYEASREATSGSRNYIKAGFGNYGSPLIEGYFGADYVGNHAGIWLNHESFSKGSVREEESAYGLTEFLIDGVLKNDKIALEPEVYYQRENYYFYGYDAEGLEALDPNTSSTLFITDPIIANHIAVSTQLSTLGDDMFRLSLKPFYQYTNMKEKGEGPFNHENKIGLGGDFAIQINERFKAGVESGFTHFKYEGGIDQTRDVFSINPYLLYQNNTLRLKGGFKYFSANDSLSSGVKSYFYPDVAADFQVTENLGLFARLSGMLQPTGLNDLRLENRYLNDSLFLLNQSIKIDFQAGIETNLSEKMQLRGFIQYKQIDNKPLFFHSSSDSSRFSVLYDPENFGEFGIGLEGRYFIGNKTTVSASMLFSGYETDTVSEAWYLPAVRLDLMATHTINEVLKLRTHLILLEGITAPDPVTFEAQDLNTIVDWSAGVQYDFIPNAGVFLDVQNILANNNERYLNYPSRGFMIKLGFIYRF